MATPTPSGLVGTCRSSVLARLLIEERRWGGVVGVRVIGVVVGAYGGTHVQTCVQVFHVTYRSHRPRADPAVLARRCRDPASTGSPPSDPAVSGLTTTGRKAEGAPEPTSPWTTASRHRSALGTRDLGAPLRRLQGDPTRGGPHSGEEAGRRRSSRCVVVDVTTRWWKGPGRRWRSSSGDDVSAVRGAEAWTARA